MPETAPAPAHRSAPPDRRRWWGLAVLLLPVLLTSMDMSILYLAIPSIAQALDPTASQMLWILDVYGFLLAGLLIVMGNVGDRIGRRRLLMLGAVVFGVASLLAAFAPSAPVLIAARALMGVGGATLMPSTLSLIRNMFPDDGERTRAIGIWTAGFAGGSALGPIAGGVLLEHFWWGSVFLVNVPVLVGLLIVTPLVVPEYRHPRPDRLDLFSAVLSLAAILPLVWAIKTVAEHGAVTPAALAAAGAGLACGAGFVARQRRLATPLVDVSLFASRRFSAALVAGSLAMFSLVGVMLTHSQYLQLVLELSPLTAALWLLPVLAAVGGFAVVATTLSSRVPSAAIVGVGAGVAAVGFVVFSGTPVDDGLARSVIGAALIGAGISGIMALATDLVVASVSPSRSGAASALSETANELGAALGIAVLGSVAAAAYRTSMSSGLPTDLPADAVAAVTSGLATALEVAARLPGDAAEALTELARVAFVDGLRASALVGAAVLAVLAVVAPILLRRGRSGAYADSSQAR
ncbi:major facilitator superfamily MFS_1 [Beutenbergia cavernae DSM 12333]|uniref:Major facilitator superfamily MFS_1 n=1 Tax=Beutenbergia cavernae (strain ATCC BAA-8 / DSM 12333 / CCUG 43141 / JCM 11478 / NBRC 16432 / NCIMB 13614 / HKI 0122) TaxID=471853 RepID=C5C2E2_BEUC1|nr:MFS transporter [Beutenbergia cavernae]ACQ79628.1 major facilitator superfamily MFS_1 [Beutenbergia cavernae DSM 12333]